MSQAMPFLHLPPTVLLSCSLALALSLGSTVTKAEPPPDVSYQGQLLAADGRPLAGPVNMQLRIYQAPAPLSGESPLYVEDHETVELREGVFSVLLGQGLPVVGSFEADLFSGADRWLEVWVDGERLVPRQPFSSVPFAFQASNASRLAGRSLAQIAPAYPRVRDANGREIGLLIDIGVGSPVLPSVLLKDLNLFLTLDLTTGRHLPLVEVVFFAQPDCRGQAYISYHSALSLIVAGDNRFFTAPIAEPRTVSVQSVLETLSGSAQCQNHPTTESLLIPANEITDQVSLRFPLPAPLSIDAAIP